MPRTYTVKEVADILGYSTNSIYAFLKEKRIKGVRVGRGRFRIPEEELSRILHLSKNKQLEKSTVMQVVNPALTSEIAHVGDDAIVEQAEEKAFRIKGLSTRIHFPNIFDWFVGISAIASGLGLFLFNITFEPVTAQAFVAFIPAVRVILVLGGIGVVVSSLMDRILWRRVFLTILCILGIANVRMFWRSGDFDAVLIYGALALLVGVHAWIQMGGVIALGWYLLTILVAAPLALYSPHGMQAVTLLAELGVSREVAALVLAAVLVLYMLTYWVGYRSMRALFWVACWMAAAVAFAFALFLFYMMFWSRGYFLISVAFFAAMLPIWRTIQLEGSRRQQILMHIVFIVVGFFIALTVLAIRQLQANAWVQNEAEIKNKTVYAASRVQDALANVERSLVAASESPLFRSAVDRGDTKEITDIAQVILESNSEIRRVIVMDDTGEGILLYPLGSFDDNNLSYRDYFVHVRDTGKPYISNAFLSMSDARQRYVVMVTVPVYSQTGTFIGAMVGSMDLERLGVQMQEIVVGALGEYVLMADGEGRRIIHPDPLLVGQDLPSDDAIRMQTVDTSPRVTLGMVGEKRQGIISYASVPDTQWTISLRAPISRVYRLTFRSSFVLVGIIGSVVLFVVFIMVLLNRRVRRFVLDGGP